MAWLLLAFFAPFLLPAACWSAGCRCDFVCPMVGSVGCYAAAAIAAAGLFAVLAFVREMTALNSIRD